MPDRSVPRPGPVAAVTLVAAFMAFLDATIVNIAIPDMHHSFPADSLGDLSWVLNAYNIVFAAFLMPFGRLADRWGRRRAFLAGLAVFTLASGVCALAGSVGVLVAARVVQAVGGAMLVPTSLALLLEVYPAARRAAAVAAYGATSAAAAGIGPSVGGVLISAQGWELVFVVNLPLGALAGVLGWRVLHESREPRGLPMPDLIGAALLGAGVGALAAAAVKGDDWGWASAATIGSLALAAAALAGMALRSARHPAPAFDPAFLRLRTFAVANAVSLVFAVAFFATLLCNVLYLTSIWHYSTLRTGLAVTPAPIAAALIALPAERLARRTGARAVALLGLVVFAVGALLYGTWIGPDPDFLGQWLPVSALTGLGAGIALPTLSAASLAQVPVARYAVGSAGNATARQVGAVFGVALLVAVVGTPAPQELREALRHGWLWASAVTLPAVVAVLFLGADTGRARGAGSGRVRGADAGRVRGVDGGYDKDSTGGGDDPGDKAGRGDGAEAGTGDSGEVTRPGTRATPRPEGT
ncbi:MFS transporter [Streptomyces sp. YIM 121038]|uniref:MFS transporter n=1 Tax=Streptomyces sp. YIM 121038 TaxID=2136401 RepID=UPI0011109B5B|nr:MFS transporter [Streptomyces sp. YIM 121038]